MQTSIRNSKFSLLLILLNVSKEGPVVQFGMNA